MTSDVPPRETTMDVAEVTGGYGPWQRNIYVLLLLASIPSSWHNLMMTFMAPPGVDYWCAPPTTEISKNVTVERWRNLSSVGGVINDCMMTPYWENVSEQHSAIKCNSWEYNTSIYASTIINEWNLVCDREWLVSLSKSIYNVGYLIGVFALGQLSDRIGRRSTLLMSYVINVVAGVLSAFSNSFQMFCVLRFFTAIGGSAFYTISFVLLVELVAPDYRETIGISINFGWCIAFISLPAVAWIVKEWFWLQLALTLPKLLFLPIFWLLPESPRWLLLQKRNDEFRKLVLQASIKNGRPQESVQKQIDRIVRDHNKHKEEDQKAMAWDILRTPGLRMPSVILFYNWLANSFVYFGLSYNTDELASNVYLNFFASGIVEFPSYACAIFITRRLGRRIPMVVGMVVGGLACALTIPIPNHGWCFTVKVLISLVGKFFVAATFSTVYVYSSEIFPTVLRNVGVGIGSTFARIGSILAPFVKELVSAWQMTNKMLLQAQLYRSLFLLFCLYQVEF